MQRERSETTRGELLASARKLFARDGFGGTSVDAVVSSSGVTKGALDLDPLIVGRTVLTSIRGCRAGC
jgi:hypothetical protein